MKNHFKTAIIVTLFNLLAEYSLRGINNFKEMPLISILLFLNYLPYFILLEDLTARYKLKDYQFALAASFFGLLWMLFGPSVIFIPPLFLGINWQRLLFVILFWWVPIQSVLPFYFANRISARNWQHPLLSRKKFTLTALWFLGATLAFRFFAYSFNNILGFFVVLGLLIMNFLVFKKSIAKKEIEEPIFRKNAVLDLLSIFMIIFFVFSATRLTADPDFHFLTYLNKTALDVGIKISFIAVLIMLAQRLFSKKSISV